MLAVIKTGGKQYLVSPGDKIKIEKVEGKELASASADAPSSAKATEGKKATALPSETPNDSEKRRRAGKGKEIIFDQVLLLEKQRKVEIGAPFVKGAKVTAKILSQGKGKKIIVFKYKPKTRYQKKAGHRQPFTEIEILKIETK